MALVPVRDAHVVAARPQCADVSGGQRTRMKWAWIAAAILAVAGVALGSIWLGFAALVPLLYTLPCLVMIAICMKGRGGNGPSPSSSR